MKNSNAGVSGATVTEPVMAWNWRTGAHSAPAVEIRFDGTPYVTVNVITLRAAEALITALQDALAEHAAQEVE